MKYIALKENEVKKILSSIDPELDEPIPHTLLSELFEQIFGDSTGAELRHAGLEEAERIWLYGDGGRGLVLFDYGNGYYLLVGLYAGDVEAVCGRLGLGECRVYDSLEDMLGLDEGE